MTLDGRIGVDTFANLDKSAEIVISGTLVYDCSKTISERTTEATFAQVSATVRKGREDWKVMEGPGTYCL